MNNDTADKTWELVQRLRDTEDPTKWEGLAEKLVPVLIDYWDMHPHSAMEGLEAVVMQLPVPLANALVRLVVSAWKAKPSYKPTAGGGAGHCYLSALILSENYDLADQPWAKEDALRYTLDKELKYPRFDRYRDGARKEQIVRNLATVSGWKPN